MRSAAVRTVRSLVLSLSLYLSLYLSISLSSSFELSLDAESLVCRVPPYATAVVYLCVCYMEAAAAGKRRGLRQTDGGWASRQRAATISGRRRCRHYRCRRSNLSFARLSGGAWRCSDRRRRPCGLPSQCWTYNLAADIRSMINDCRIKVETPGW